MFSECMEDCSGGEGKEEAKQKEVVEEPVKIPPDYYESSEEEGGEKRAAGCQCSGSGSCNYCKKMRGCTCDGAGTCRLCEEETDEEDDIEIIEETQPQSQPATPMTCTEWSKRTMLHLRL